MRNPLLALGLLSLIGAATCGYFALPGTPVAFYAEKPVFFFGEVGQNETLRAEFKHMAW